MSQKQKLTQNSITILWNANMSDMCSSLKRSGLLTTLPLASWGVLRFLIGWLTCFLRERPWGVLLHRWSCLMGLISKKCTFVGSHLVIVEHSLEISLSFLYFCGTPHLHLFGFWMIVVFLRVLWLHLVSSDRLFELLFGRLSLKWVGAWHEFSQ